MFIDYPEPVEVLRVRGHCEAALRLDGGLAEAWSVDSLACAYGAQFGAATDLMRRALALSPNSGAVFYHTARVCMSALALRPAAAMLERAAQLSPGDPHALAQNGRAEAALDALEATVDGGWRGPWARPWLDRDSDFDALRGNPRFARLAAQVGPAA